MVNDIPEMANEHLSFSTRDEKNLLLMKVLQASESDIQEEEIKEESSDVMVYFIARWVASENQF